MFYRTKTMVADKVSRLPRETLALLVIISIAVLTRVVAALYLGNEVVPLPGSFDQISYHQLALRLLDGYGFTFGQYWWPATPAGEPTAMWSYLYTIYLYVVYTIVGPNPLAARLLQGIAVGILHPYLCYRLGRHIAGETVGLIAAGLTAIYAYFIYYAATLMTEPFYITAILAGLLMLLRLADNRGQGWEKQAIALGLILGITILLRQLFILLIPFLFLWLLWARWHRRQSLPVRALVIAVFVVGLMIIPFTAYNYGRFDRVVLLNTNAGYAFFWSNHPVYGTHFEPILPSEMGDYAGLIPPELRHLDEAALDQALLRRGLGFVIEEPHRYLMLSVSRIPAYFKFWPSPTSDLLSNISRVFSFGLLWPFMVAGIVLALQRAPTSDIRQDAMLLLLLFATLYTAIHLLSWALIRYRLPADAVLLFFAAYCMEALWLVASRSEHRRQLLRRITLLD